MDDKTPAAQRGNLSTLVELLRSAARLIRNGALSDRGATGLVLRRKGKQIVREAHALDPVKWSRTLSPVEREAFINETGIDLGDQPLPIGPPETDDELHAHLWRAFLFGMKLRNQEVGSPPSAEELETCADTLARFDQSAPAPESSFGRAASSETATTPTRTATDDGVVPPGAGSPAQPGKDSAPDALDRDAERAAEKKAQVSNGDDNRPKPPPIPGIAPPMKRPVLVSEAAEPAGKRSDVLLKMLRARHYPIDGPQGAYVAELNHIIATVPKRRKAIQQWADEKYPVE